MAKPKAPSQTRSRAGRGGAREDRLAAALRANLSRRKDQARARADAAPPQKK